jgi:hypothetical protein
MRSQEIVEVRFVSSTSDELACTLDMQGAAEKGKRRRVVHRLQDGLLPSFSIFSQGENRLRRGTMDRPTAHS